ncbi:elongin BC and Polycomb repressive complex 2-associated protein [Bos javanicus]|uniref:elongin BC and Polycomb repressive complex 2-associated protein n=1 Tax=Bos javanicus TaxID=9906 RepID=UPI002AA6A55E|nr:elongin BC and Polycomb repressive complex 2-associated protein [Bos javanicus]
MPRSSTRTGWRRTVKGRTLLGPWEGGGRGVEGPSLLKGARSLPRRPPEAPGDSRSPRCPGGVRLAAGPGRPHPSPTPRPRQPRPEPSPSRLRATEATCRSADEEESGRPPLPPAEPSRKLLGETPRRALSLDPGLMKGPQGHPGPCVPTRDASAPSRLLARPEAARVTRQERACGGLPSATSTAAVRPGAPQAGLTGRGDQQGQGRSPTPPANPPGKVAQRSPQLHSPPAATLNLPRAPAARCLARGSRTSEKGAGRRGRSRPPARKPRRPASLRLPAGNGCGCVPDRDGGTASACKTPDGSRDLKEPRLSAALSLYPREPAGGQTPVRLRADQTPPGPRNTFAHLHRFTPVRWLLPREQQAEPLLPPRHAPAAAVCLLSFPEGEEKIHPQ